MTEMFTWSQFFWNNRTPQVHFKMSTVSSLFFAIALVLHHSSSLSVPQLPKTRSFDGHRVYRVQSQTRGDYDALVELLEEDRLDFWTMPRINGFTDIMVDPDQRDQFLDYVNDRNLNYSMRIPDVESLVDKERQVNMKRRTAGVDWEAYYPVQQIYDWMDSVAAANPSLARVVTYGRSYEGRPLKLIEISRGGTEKPTIFVDATFHAREWIAAAVATNIINELTTNSGSYRFLDHVNFFIVPIVNPDGYEYSHTSDRLWRKTRADYRSASGCKGVDPNRNFGFEWGGSGTSSNKCSEIYKGPSAFSEPETAALRDFIMNSKAPFKSYITIHSYSQLWLTPWGFTSSYPDDYADLESLGHKAVYALKRVHGTDYTVGSSTNVLYAAAGGSDDWAKGSANIKYAYTVELRDTGKHGFVLPASMIKETAAETWAGLQVVANHVAGLTE